ncbi:MAG: acyl-ACP thioesterase domain-containing protein [Bacteroidota bacterium]
MTPPPSPGGLVSTQSFLIRAYEVGPDELASILTVCDLLQEAAGEHARSLGRDGFDLPDGRFATWVLSRLRVRLAQRPRIRETVTIETWPSDLDGLRAFRDFRMTGDEGSELATATSTWFLIDPERRRPVRLPPEMNGFAARDRERALTVASSSPTSPESPEVERSFAVRRSDLDRVGHANNVRFIEWALEALGDDAGLREIDIQYRAEAVYGDTVVSRASALAKGARNHELARASDGTTLALARTLWMS